MYPILFHFGPVTLHTYGLLVALGFLTGLFVARRTFALADLPIGALDTIVGILMISGIIGARLSYFMMVDPAAFRADPLSVLRIWEGGLVYYGGFIAALLALAVYARKSQFPFLALSDAFVPPLLIAHAIGRLGCFSAGCCYGRPTDSLFGVVFKNPDSLAPRFVPLHPTQLYESLGDAILFGIAWLLTRRRLKRGSVTVFYLIGYGLFRFAVEFLRDDDRGAFLGFFSPSQWIGLTSACVGALIFIYVKNSPAR